MLPEDVVFIGIPDLAKKVGLSRQIMHHRAKYGLLTIKAYPLRRNRQMTYVFDEKEVDEYVRQRNEAKKVSITPGEPNAA